MKIKAIFYWKKHKLHLHRLFCCNTTCNCVNMVSVTSASSYITSASLYHPRYQSRFSMFIHGLIPRNFAELAEAVGIGADDAPTLNAGWILACTYLHMLDYCHSIDHLRGKFFFLPQPQSSMGHTCSRQYHRRFYHLVLISYRSVFHSQLCLDTQL